MKLIKHDLAFAVIVDIKLCPGHQLAIWISEPVGIFNVPSGQAKVDVVEYIRACEQLVRLCAQPQAC